MLDRSLSSVVKADMQMDGTTQGDQTGGRGGVRVMGAETRLLNQAGREGFLEEVASELGPLNSSCL